LLGAARFVFDVAHGIIDTSATQAMTVMLR
jgi:hypothetical protein